MAVKRMFSMKIVDTDWFMDMPASSQNLYFHLSMRADDDGFVSSPKRIVKLIGASEDDYKLLIAKNFIIPFESGVCVIKDWRINNYLRNDRKTNTIYQEELSKLSLGQNEEYLFGIPSGIPLVSTDISNTKSLTDTINNYNFSEKLVNKINDWLEYKKEKKQSYKPKGLTGLLSRIKKDVEEHGEQYVIDAILYSMSMNYSGIFAEKTNNYQKSNNSQPKPKKEYKINFGYVIEE